LEIFALEVKKYDLNYLARSVLHRNAIKNTENNSMYRQFDDEKCYKIFFKAEIEDGQNFGQPEVKIQFPWHAAIMSDKNVCGGSLLDSNWVLTTASCVRKYISSKKISNED
jgi:Trypsin